MTKAQKYITILSCVFLVLIIILKTKTTKDDELKIEVIRIDEGWGYNILKDDKIYIHQPFIPAIQGKKAFMNKKDALKVGKFAISKMNKGNFPTITKNELDSLAIQF